MLVLGIVYIIVKIILYILLALLLLLLAVLLIPFKYYVRGENIDDKILEGYVSWLFGGIKMRFCYSSEEGTVMLVNFLGFKKKLDVREKKHDKKEDEKKDRNRKKSENTYSYVTYRVVKKAFHTVMKLLDHCKPRQLEIKAKVGFEDPMYTGLLCGMQGAGFAILDRFNIRLQPTFEEEEISGSLILGGSIQIFRLLLVMMEFVFTRPFRSILLKNIKTKIKRRMRAWRILILKKT